MIILSVSLSVCLKNLLFGLLHNRGGSGTTSGDGDVITASGLDCDYQG